MDGLASLKLHALDLRQDLDRLAGLYEEYQEYVRQLADLLREKGEPNTFRAAQTKLMLQLRDEEGRFLEWHNGEHVLNHAVFALADPTEEVRRPEVFGSLLMEATAKFEHLIRAEHRELAELHEKIALMSSEEEAKAATSLSSRSAALPLSERFLTADKVAEVGVKWGTRLLRFAPWAAGIIKTLAQ